jgi:hypothetical protein
MAPPPLFLTPQAPPANKPAVSVGCGFFEISGFLTMWPLPGRLVVFKKLGKKGPILLKITFKTRISPKDSYFTINGFIIVV